jgi:hypothetical protein
MADLTSFAQTYSNAGAAITTAYLPANNFKITDGYNGGAYGTRELSFLKITLTGIETTPTISSSNFVKAIQGVQRMAEVYYAAVLTTNEAIVIVSKDTLSASDTATDDTAGYGLFEAAINAATGGSATVTAAVFA